MSSTPDLGPSKLDISTTRLTALNTVLYQDGTTNLSTYDERGKHLVVHRCRGH